MKNLGETLCFNLFAGNLGGILGNSRALGDSTDISCLLGFSGNLGASGNFIVFFSDASSLSGLLGKEGNLFLFILGNSIDFKGMELFLELSSIILK